MRNRFSVIEQPELDPPIIVAMKQVYASVVIDAIKTIVENDKTRVPYFMARRGDTKQNRVPRIEMTTERAVSMAWVFSGEQMKHKPAVTFIMCCEALNIEPEIIQRYIAKAIMWQKRKVPLAGTRPTEGENNGKIDHRVFYKILF